MFTNLKAEMVRNDMSQKDLADLINVSVVSISNKINGKTDFTLSEIVKISERLGKQSIDYLFKK